jgi:hypothetical protein
MPPAPLSMIVLCHFSATKGAARWPFVANERFDHLLFAINRYVIDKPGTFDTEQLLLKFTISHGAKEYDRKFAGCSLGFHLAIGISAKTSRR